MVKDKFKLTTHLRVDKLCNEYHALGSISFKSYEAFSQEEILSVEEKFFHYSRPIYLEYSNLIQKFHLVVIERFGRYQGYLRIILKNPCQDNHLKIWSAIALGGSPEMVIDWACGDMIKKLKERMEPEKVEV